MSDSGRKTWFAIDVAAHPEAAEPVEYAFNVLGCLGTEINYQKNEAPSSHVRITGYFDKLPNNKALTQALRVALQIYALSPASVITTETRAVPETDWLAEWKLHWQPTEVGRFVIAPPWAEIPETEKIVIRIEPNMAFGTGTHETTQLCVEAISSDFRDGMSFLDVGTGTGILAIAAAKLSPRSKITAFDIDPDAVKIARENAIANGVDDSVEFFEGSVTSQTPTHDFVCANLTLDVISPLLSTLVAKTNETLLLSGILSEQEKLISDQIKRFEISNSPVIKPGVLLKQATVKFTYSGEWLSALINK